MANKVKTIKRVRDGVIFPWSAALAARVTEFVEVKDEAAPAAVLPDEALAMVELPEDFEIAPDDAAALAEMQQESEPDAEVAPVRRGPGRPRRS